MENYYKTSFNPFKNNNIFSKKLKVLLVTFIRRYYNSTEKYADTVLYNAETNLIKFLVDILFNGFILYVALTSLIFIFPRLTSWIYLGTGYWQIPLSIFFLGWAYWTGEKIIKSTRGKK